MTTKPNHAQSRTKHSETPQSYIAELRQPAPVIRLGAPSGAASAGLLAKAALDHATRGEQAFARRAAEDAASMIAALESSQAHALVAAEAALTNGEAFLLLHEAHRAKSSFELASRVFDDANDRRRSADARLGLAKALIALNDPSARAILEDAGELYEDLNDGDSVRGIDLQLRQLQAELEESPRSFHASSTMMRAARPV